MSEALPSLVLDKTEFWNAHSVIAAWVSVSNAKPFCWKIQRAAIINLLDQYLTVILQQLPWHCRCFQGKRTDDFAHPSNEPVHSS